MVEITILCSDKGYANALMESLSEEFRPGARISVYTDPIKYNPQEVDDVYYVTAYEELSDWEGLIIPERTLFLTELDQKCPNRNAVSKYSSVELIKTKLIEIMTGNDKTGAFRQDSVGTNSTKSPKLVGFFSPVRRCSQTTLSLTMGNVISETNKVLFISFESFSPLFSLIESSKKKTMEDLLLITKESPEKFNLFFETVVYHGDFIDILPPIKSLHQILDVRAKDWIDLINQIKIKCDYDVIILDLSETIHGLLDLMGMCERIYTLTQEDRFAKAKLNEYETLLRNCEHDDIMYKTVKHRLPYIEEIPDAFHYQPFSVFAKYVREMIMGDGLYARLCVD
ncbi:MAG: hypothetical protein J5537_12730 [Lachnospiraceae bacterium]|nr:hypothetical protein [Lachnospiraceae bacterium]